MSNRGAGLNPRQAHLLNGWVPDAQVVADHSWGLVETTVLELLSEQGRLIVKAGGEADHHIAREIRAHRQWVGVWAEKGCAPTLRYADIDAKLLVTDYLPGVLVQGHSAQDRADTFRQAGALLAEFHGQAEIWDPTWNDRWRGRVQDQLSLPHRIDHEIEDRIRVEVAQWPTGGASLVPTHGDWQPRNWLIDDETVRIIDFGRTDLRPAIDDFVRLSNQDFARDADLEAAFLAGYGSDPRIPDAWRRAQVGEAVGTATWAYQVRDEGFERVGHELLARLYP